MPCSIRPQICIVHNVQYGIGILISTEFRKLQTDKEERNEFRYCISSTFKKTKKRIANRGSFLRIIMIIIITTFPSPTPKIKSIRYEKMRKNEKYELERMREEEEEEEDER